MSVRPFLTLAMTVTIAGLAAFGAGAQTPAPGSLAGEWPQWRGPERTGIARDTGLLKTWPAGGPRLVWKAGDRGLGYSTPSVTGGRVYGMGNQGQNECVWAVDASTGQQVWSTPIAAAQRVDRGDGSRSTPTVDGNRIYALGVGGELVCLDTANGRVQWRKSLTRDFGGSVPPWGYTESPLVDGPLVTVTPGGRNTMVALNKMNGQQVWASPVGDAAHYSSIIAADVDGQRHFIQFLAGGVVGVSSRDGRLLWRYNNPANRVANCATPIFRDGHVFAASNYGNGGGLAKLTTTPQGVSATEVFFTKRMQNHHGGIVLVGDYLYGADNSNLTCINFKTGQVMWADRSVGKGSVSAADGMLYVRGERDGAVALVEANPQRYTERGRLAQPDLSGTNTWAHPVIAGGRLYLRDQNTLLCYDVKAAAR